MSVEISTGTWRIGRGAAGAPAHLIEDRPAPFDLAADETRIFSQAGVRGGRDRRPLELARRQGDRRQRRRQLVRRPGRERRQRHEMFGASGLRAHRLDLFFASRQSARCLHDEIGRQFGGGGHGDPHREQVRREIVQAVMRGIELGGVPVDQESISDGRAGADAERVDLSERQRGVGDLHEEDHAERIEGPSGELEKAGEERDVQRRGPARRGAAKSRDPATARWPPRCSRRQRRPSTAPAAAAGNRSRASATPRRARCPRRPRRPAEADQPRDGRQRRRAQVPRRDVSEAGSRARWSSSQYGSRKSRHATVAGRQRHVDCQRLSTDFGSGPATICRTSQSRAGP